MNTFRRLLAGCCAIGQLVFVSGWFVLGLIEGHGYSPARHDISDLAALTAQHATVDRLTLALSGALTIAFGLSIRHVFGCAAWLVALSLPGLDNLSDAFFRLDCRAADAGCGMAEATASWHGKVHIASFVIAALATMVAPFALSRRMRHAVGWEDLARPTWVFGFVVIALLAATAATSGSEIQGWTQRGAATIVVSGLAVLAWRVVQLESRTPRVATLIVGR
jgi:hypothetical protein